MKILKTRGNKKKIPIKQQNGSKFYCIFRCKRCDYNVKTSILAPKTQLSGEFTYKEHFITQNFRKFTYK
jgi:hypothetical protein